MSMESIPKDLRNLRACLLCSLVKTFEQFEFDGCDNCDEYLVMKNNRDAVYDCTSSNFDGLIAVMSPEDSWVCKWQRIIAIRLMAELTEKCKISWHFNKYPNWDDRYTKGIYAISVSGRLPPATVRELKTRGITYKSRDTSIH